MQLATFADVCGSSLPLGNNKRDSRKKQLVCESLQLTQLCCVKELWSQQNGQL